MKKDHMIIMELAVMLPNRHMLIGHWMLQKRPKIPSDKGFKNLKKYVKEMIYLSMVISKNNFNFFD